MDQKYIINGVVGGVMPVLAISGAAAATFKTTNAINVKIDGAVSSIAAATLTVLPATITVPAASTAAVGVYVNAAGVTSYTVGTPVLNSSLATNVIFAPTNLAPQDQYGKALIGWVIIKATTTAFAGGTTAFDAATYTVTYLDKPAVTF